MSVVLYLKNNINRKTGNLKFYLNISRDMFTGRDRVDSVYRCDPLMFMRMWPVLFVSIYMCVCNDYADE